MRADSVPAISSPPNSVAVGLQFSRRGFATHGIIDARGLRPGKLFELFCQFMELAKI